MPDGAHWCAGANKGLGASDLAVGREPLEVTTRAPQWPQGMAYTGHVLDNLTRLTYAS